MVNNLKKKTRNREYNSSRFQTFSSFFFQFQVRKLFAIYNLQENWLILSMDKKNCFFFCFCSVLLRTSCSRCGNYLSDNHTVYINLFPSHFFSKAFLFSYFSNIYLYFTRSVF